LEKAFGRMAELAEFAPHLCCACVACITSPYTWAPCTPHYTTIGKPAIGSGVADAGELKYTVEGDSLPCLELQLAPGQQIIGECGALCYMQQGIEMSAKFDDGSDPTGAREGYSGICTWKTYKRSCMAKESCVVVHFKNGSDKEQYIGLSNDAPGQLKLIDLNDLTDNTLFAFQGAFYAGQQGTNINAAKADCKQCCCGAGLFMQTLQGNGKVFLEGGGTVVEMKLENETAKIDPDALLAFEKGLTIDIQRAGGCCTMCCGGEGLAFTTLSGTGRYWLASSGIMTQINHALQFLPPKKK
jgi:uncharacterized protein (AIM24 family)